MNDAPPEGSPPARLRVMIADDHPVVREGLRAVLAALPDAELVGTAATGTAAVRLAAEQHPDVILMDVRMPELDGVEATRQILAAQPQVAVLVLTMYDDDEHVVAALRAGARGYLLKGASHAEITRALRAVAAGGALFGTGVAGRVLDRAAGKPASANPFPELTRRELEVLTLLAQGSGNQEIARRLYISAKTVRNHVANILVKLGAADRAQAIVQAREAGLAGEHRRR
jgi:DNA-binding NarL/FixJ family response regulator